MNRTRILAAMTATVSALLAGCGDGSYSTDSGSLQIPTAQSLTIADVQQVIAQAVAEAQARGAAATIVVVDRVGNVLAAFEMTGSGGFTINGQRGVTGGLEGISVLPTPLAAISKALTAAYFSSAGNAFTTRTAGQIIQEHFQVGQANAPAGPLFGVQFSQLTCSDVSKQATAGTIGPKRAPLGFAADPGGLPLYKNGSVVGAVGVISDGQYSLVRDYILDQASDQDELIAVAATHGFAAPDGIRADHITAGGVALRFDTSEALKSTPASAPTFASIDGVAGHLINVTGYGGSPIAAGTAYGTAASGIRADTNPAFAGLGDYILVDAANNNRYPPIAGTDGLMTAAEVTQILKSTLQVANRTRAQVRQPVGSTAQVSAVVVDTNGAIVGYIRSPDALVDSVDVVTQKARTAAFFSNPNAAAELLALPAASYVKANGAPSGVQSSIAAYVTEVQNFFGNPNQFSDGVAFSTRSIGNIASPFFPDGIEGTINGPLARPYANWSIFQNGLELDLVYNQLLRSLTVDDRSTGCTGTASRIKNGITLFAGGFPIYRGSQLVGAIGVSGDGTDQSDLIAFLGVANAGAALKTGIGHAPKAMRADTLAPKGVRLRYVNCPQAPFIDSTEPTPCDGL